MAEFVSFHVHESFALKLGSKGMELIVPRMKFITGGKVIQKISEIQSKELASIISSFIEAKKGNQMSVTLQDVIATLLKEKNFDAIKDLVALISENVISESVINDCDCQFEEAVKILSYLLDGNFSSLKNLSASLQAITGNGR